MKKLSSSKSFQRLSESTQRFIVLTIAFLIMVLLLRFFEIAINSYFHNLSEPIVKLGLSSLINDFLFWCKVSTGLFFAFMLLYSLHKPLGSTFYFMVIALLFVSNILLVQYFLSAMVPLGADLFGYSFADIKQTVGTAGVVSLTGLAALVFLIALAATVVILVVKKLRVPLYPALGILLIIFAGSFINPKRVAGKPSAASEYINDLSLNKTDFFLQQSFVHFFPPDTDVDIYASDYLRVTENVVDSFETFTYLDEVNYPFLHEDKTTDVLSPFMDSSSKPPNIVMILVEGLGKAFSNEGAYLGSFTPFLDSLSQHSLYWENFLSEGGRTFAVLPSILGSLPFYYKGFTALGDSMPNHLSLINILKHNGYHTSFYYGGDASFDNMRGFLSKSSIDKIYEEKSFPGGYTKMPLSKNNFTWGFGDKEVYRWYLETKKESSTQPYLSVILTVASHFPFLINDQQQYLQKVRDRMTELQFDEEKKTAYKPDEAALASVLFADDALRQFLKAYSFRSDFENTIFIISGDHRIPEIAMRTKLDRFHVPFILFSPMLKRTATFSSISTHFDVTPTLLSFLKMRNNIEVPSVVSWMGGTIDTSRMLRNKHAYPLKANKYEVHDFIMGNYQLNNSNLFAIGEDLTLTQIDDEKRNTQLSNNFLKFKRRNQQLMDGALLIPDSVYKRFALK